MYQQPVVKSPVIFSWYISSVSYILRSGRKTQLKETFTVESKEQVKSASEQVHGQLPWLWFFNKLFYFFSQWLTSLFSASYWNSYACTAETVKLYSVLFQGQVPWHSGLGSYQGCAPQDSFASYFSPLHLLVWLSIHIGFTTARSLPSGLRMLT